MTAAIRYDLPDQRSNGRETNRGDGGQPLASQHQIAGDLLFRYSGERC